MRIIVIEDYQPLRQALVKGLQEAGHVVDQCADGAEASQILRQSHHELIILDWMLPGMDGEGIVRELRARGDCRPVLLLTAKDQIGDRIAGLDAGADDYLVKPFDFGELLARVRALGRRSQANAANTLVVEDLVVDRGRRTVERDGRRLDLTVSEYVLLELLASHAGSVVLREDLRSALYQEKDSEAHSNVIDVYIGYLRRKVDLPGLRRLIHTRRGYGYLLGLAP